MMADWDRVKQVFQAALEWSLETRPTFLDETCGDDAALRAEVESLLRGHEQAGSFAPDLVISQLWPERMSPANAGWHAACS